MVVSLPISLIILLKTYSLPSTIMESAFLYVLYRSLLMTVVILAVFTLRYLFEKRLSPTVRHALWFFLLPVMLLPLSSIPIFVPEKMTSDKKLNPVPIIFIPIEEIELERTNGPTEIPLLSQKTVKEKLDQIVLSENQDTIRINIVYRSAFTFTCLAAMIWIAGCVVLLGLSLFQVLRYRRRFAKASTITDEKTLPLLDRCRNDLKIKTPVRLLESRRLLFPVLVGSWNPRIILPTGFVGRCSDEQLTHFFLHELAHLKRRDIVTGWLMSLFCIVHWFNPFVWIAIRTMNADAEEAADQLATKAFDKKRRIEYGRTLLALSERLNEIPKRILPSLSECVPGVVGLMESSTQLSRRIEMLKQRETWHRGWMFLVFVLCLAVSAATLTRFQFVAAQTTRPEQHQSEKTPVVLPEPLERIKVSGTVIPPDGIDREKVDLKRLEIEYGTKLRSNPNQGGGGNAVVKEDGSFTMETLPDCDGIAYLFDPKNEWTAEPAFFSVDRSKSENEPIIRPEKGLLLEGTLLDKTNEHPVSGMRIWLSRQYYRNNDETIENTHLMLLSLETDENGRFACRVMPGSYKMNVDVIHFDHAEEREIYSFDAEIKGDDDAKPVLKIPSPFTGKVLQADSDEPAKDVSVSIQSLDSSNWLRVKTDKNGLFHQRKTPCNSLIEITDLKNGTGFIAWTGNDLSVDSPMEIRLKKWKSISGRLIDSENGKPMSDKNIFYQYENPSSPEQKREYFYSVKSDKEGCFKINNLLPDMKYKFYYVPVPGGKGYSGNSIGPRVLLDSFQVKEDAEKRRNVGDWTVDLTRLASDPDEETMKIYEQKIRGANSLIKSGQKKALLQITAFKQAYPTVEYIEKLQSEGKLDDFAVIIMKVDDFPKSFARQAMPYEKDGLLLAMQPGFDNNADDITPSFLSLAQLRGEKDSPWNVPKDDASNEGDWKKTPGMVNPKILDNFLNDYIRKFEKQDKPKGVVDTVAELPENAVVCSVFLGVVENDDSKQSLLSLISEKQKDRMKIEAAKSSGEEILNELAKEKRISVLSRPQVVAIDGIQALIKIGDDSDSTLIHLTPRIQDDGTIQMELSLETKSTPHEDGSVAAKKWGALADIPNGKEILLTGTTDGKEFVLFVSAKRVAPTEK